MSRPLIDMIRELSQSFASEKLPSDSLVNELSVAIYERCSSGGLMSDEEWQSLADPKLRLRVLSAFLIQVQQFRMAASIKQSLFGPVEVVGSHRHGGLELSTVKTKQGYFETAIGDSKGWHPVQRYDTLEFAEEGHASWKHKIGQGLHTVTKLGLGPIEDEFITLVPMEN